ncbi:MAG: TRAP transporter small permease [Syntrophorhabdaceae bacterium]|nr:TRAP transporter small permease [Syntrophorhabdaceae bacterium]
MTRIISIFNRIEEATVAFYLLGLAILTFLETMLRYTVSYTFPWFGELANYSMIFCTYLGASIGVKYGTHFSMEALTECMPDRVSHVLKAFAYLISGIVAVIIVYYGTIHLLKLKGFGVKSSAMGIPMYIPYIPIPLFSITMAFRLFSLSLKHFKAFLKNAPFERVRGRKG